jgi:FlaA1/EpsC-like NDP-sugar epimerase
VSDQSLFARLRATGRLWQTLLVPLDAVIVLIATVIAYYARFEAQIPQVFGRWMLPLAGVAVIVYVAMFALAGLYKIVLRYVGVDTLLRLIVAVAASFAVLLTLDLLLPPSETMRLVPVGVLFIQAVLVFLGAAATRLAARVLLYLRSSRGRASRRVLIIGAGSAGSLLLREIQHRPDLELGVIGFLDDLSPLQGRTIGGVQVLGPTSELASVVESEDVDEIIVAMPSASQETVRRILNAAADAEVQTRIMPELVIAKGSVNLRDLRSVDVEDLLGREPTPIDVGEVRDTLAGRCVAVTGAAGSIGAELCRQIARMDPEKLLLIDVDESRLYELWLELADTSPEAVVCVCDIRDSRKLDEVFATERPSVVLHAAAYKHVPLMELAADEAVKTNIQGTRELIAACEHHEVERFVLISTDKAVSPVNMMGLTKCLAERVLLDAVRRTNLNAVAVRFGNVLGSRGSVVPIFEKQLRHGGPLTVTAPEVTRYFMTIPEASRLVLQAQAIGEPGDIFVLEMGEPVRIVDLARKMIALSGVPADITFVGLRPGEKLHEDLISGHERLVPTVREKIQRVDRVVIPDQDFDDEVTELVRCAESDDRQHLLEAIETLEPGFLERSRASS